MGRSLDERVTNVAGTRADAEPTADELGAMLARELRRPLTMIEAYLELLLNGAVGADGRPGSCLGT